MLYIGPTTSPLKKKKKKIKDDILSNKSIVCDHYNYFSKKMSIFEFASGGWGSGWM